MYNVPPQNIPIKNHMHRAPQSIEVEKETNVIASTKHTQKQPHTCAVHYAALGKGEGQHSCRGGDRYLETKSLTQSLMEDILLDYLSVLCISQ
jgi:hypothetical protein